MPVHDLKDQIARLPEQPGVYLWRDAKGDKIYVGKARSLRDRVRSYLGAYGMSPRHDATFLGARETIRGRQEQDRAGGAGTCSTYARRVTSW